MKSAEQKLLPYLFSFSLLFVYLIGLNIGEIWSYFLIFFVFVFIPIVEPFVGTDETNPNKYEEIQWKNHFSFFILLCVHLFAALIVLVTFFSFIIEFEPTLFEIIGAVISTGIILGLNAIPVAHELLHRDDENERLLGKILLFVTNYSHFSVEHIEGHHKNIGTDSDTGTAQIRHSLYYFWFRSLFGGYFSAWKIETERTGGVNFQNRMLNYTLISLAYNFLIFIAVDTEVYLWFLLSTIIGMLLYETINYIHHYGLFRYSNESGLLEEISAKHSWNTNLRLSRWLLLEHSLHSDHHLNPNRQYQLRRRIEGSPQLPYGIPAMIILALFPPSWFGKMDAMALSIVRQKTEDVISLTPQQKPRDTFDID